MSDDRSPAGDGHISDVELSAYLDGEIESETARRAIAAHLGECAACREALNELATLVGLLGGLPLPEPPRSFRLTEEMVPAARVIRTPWFIRLQPALRWATAVAAVLLVLVIGADLVANRATSSPPVDLQSAAAPTTVQALAAPSAPAAGSAAQTSAGAAAASPVPRAATSAPRATATATPTATPALVPATAPPVAAPAAGSPSGWRIAELGIALLLLWLLVATVALPRLRRAGS